SGLACGALSLRGSALPLLRGKRPRRRKMTAVQPARSLEWPVPGPGTWTIDAVHHPRPVTRYFAEMHPEPFRRGFAEFCRFYGMVIGGLEGAYVNGLAYHHMAEVPPEEFPMRFARAAE